MHELSIRAAGSTLASTRTAVTSQTRQYALASYLLATDGRQYLSVGGVKSKPLDAAPDAGWTP